VRSGRRDQGNGAHVDRVGTRTLEPRAPLDEVRDGEHLIALIIRASYQADGIQFFTDRGLSQQLGYMRRPKGHVISAHVHNKVHRDVEYTQEVLIVRTRRLRVDLYDAARGFLAHRILEPGDIILLASGGHGFEMLEEVEMIEVKQGPYTPTDDKTFFTPTTPRSDHEPLADGSADDRDYTRMPR